MFYSRHFVRHLGICNRICVKLLQLMSVVITHNSVKTNEVSILINGWVTANYSVSRPPFCSPSWHLQSDLCKTLTGYVRCHSTSNRFPGVHKRGIHTDTTHTHTHMSIAIGEMQCVAFRLKMSSSKYSWNFFCLRSLVFEFWLGSVKSTRNCLFI